MTSTDDRSSFQRDAVATAAVTLYSLVVAIGFARVFSGWNFLTDLAVLAVVGHGVSFLMRRARISGWLSIPFMSALLIWVLLAQQFGSTLTWLVPRRATWDQVDLEVGLVRDQFQTAVAPVFYGPGWATLAGFALIVVIVMSDSFAFRAEARGEALVPGGVLFVFIAALSSDRLRIFSTGLLLAAGVLVVIALRWLHDRRRRVELTARRGPASLAIPAALATAVSIALLAGLIGPRLPGAQAEPLYNTRGRGGGTTEVISPLVDIRSRLVNRGETELFRINADVPAYWRAITLPEFDGTVFGVPTTRLERIEGSDGQVGPGDSAVRQKIQILSLGGNLVPAAADPIRADGGSGGTPIKVLHNRETDSLVTPDGDVLSGDEFTVISSVPTLSRSDLQSASSANPPDPVFLGLPDDMPDIVADLTAQVTAGTTNSYDAAIALQNWFQREFEYSLDVQKGHGSNAIESFLNQRVGYCEQFAATYAAMTRTIGIPSRVAVGFTPGLPRDDGWYSVLGKNAHAWPELWFDGIGWVGFEPTPGRGAPGAEAYTGLPPAQDTTPQAAPGGPVDPNAPVLPTTPSTLGPSSTVLPNGGPRTDSPFDDPNFPFAEGSTPAATETDSTGSSNTAWIVLAVIAGLVALTAAPWVVRQIRRRSLRAHGPVERVQLAWLKAVAAAEQAGVTGRASMTSREWAVATATQLPVAARPMRSLAEMVDLVTYSPPGSVDFNSGSFGATIGRECDLWSDQVDRIAIDGLTTPQRIKRHFTTWR